MQRTCQRAIAAIHARGEKARRFFIVNQSLGCGGQVVPPQKAIYQQLTPMHAPLAQFVLRMRCKSALARAGDYFWGL